MSAIDRLVRYEVADAVATITLDNPPLNVMNLAMVPQLDAAIDAAERDDAVRAVVLAGAGERAFCAGSDIAEFDGFTEPGTVVPRKLWRQYEVFGRLERLPKPVVAALHGYVYGGGIELAVCCDLLVADADARFASAEIKLGVFPGTGGPIRTTRRIGEGRAKQLMFLGDPIDAATALSWGLVDQLAEPGGSLEQAAALAGRLARGPRRALGHLKAAIGLAFDAESDVALRRILELSDAAFSSPECAEGVRAFRARERPRFEVL